jgi:hypothetical protein
MGGSKPTVVTPPPPKVYQSIIPLEDYKATAAMLNRFNQQAQQSREQLFAMGGTPAEIGARAAGTRLQEAASYASSLPKNLPSSQIWGPGSGSPMTPAADSAAQAAADARVSSAQEAYATALQHAQDKPESWDVPYDPEWAKRTIGDTQSTTGSTPEAAPEAAPKTTDRLSRAEIYARWQRSR